MLLIKGLKRPNFTLVKMSIGQTLNKNIEMCISCQIFLEFATTNSKEPLIPHDILSIP